MTRASGVSAREMVQAMVQGESNAVVLAELAHGRLRSKRAELAAALAGQTGEHHRFLLNSHLQHIDILNEQIERFSEQIAAPCQCPCQAGAWL